MCQASAIDSTIWPYLYQLNKPTTEESYPVTAPIVAPRYTSPCIPARPEGSAASCSGRNIIPVLDSASRSSRTARAVLFCLLSTAVTLSVATPAPAPAPAGLELVWSDDFDGTTIDPTKWDVFTGNYGTPKRVQIYSDAPENVRVENGALILEATLEDGQWYSGMVSTNDVQEPNNSRFARGNLGWTFGRFEIRARVPHATGMWPALWMRPIDFTYGVNDKGKGWPLNGEIDILEYIGPDHNPQWPNAPINELVANAHWQQDGKRKQRKGTFDLGGPEAAAAFVSEWHTYAVEWTPHRLEYFVDGQSYHVIENWASDTGGIGPFDQNFDIIMNLQVGGWPGDPVPSSAGSQMEIDWVRVYQDNG